MTRHRLDLFSLLSGLTLVAIALVALFGLTVDVAAWVWPTVLIAVGVVVIGSVVRSDGAAEEVTDAAAGDDRTEAMAAAQAEVEEVDRTTD